MRTPLYITSLEASSGKTLVTLGLVSEFSQTFDKIGFIKPLGVSRLRAGSDGIDLDAMLVEKLHAVHENIKDMCPVTLGSANWPVVSDAESAKMLNKIKEAYARVSHERDAVIVEGSGGAALGSCLGLSNAKIAKEFGCKTLFVVEYGTRDHNPWDRVLLHRDHFKAHGVENIGVIINKVPVDMLDSYRPYAASMFERLGVEVIGTIPIEQRLNTFRVLEVSQYLKGEFIANSSQASRMVSSVRIGAMTPHRAISFFTAGTLVITPGDREDIMVTVCALAAEQGEGPSGLVLSAGVRPHRSILELLEKSGIPTFLAEEDSYTVASKIHDMPLRIQPTDEDKIALAQAMVVDHVNVERIVEQL